MSLHPFIRAVAVLAACGLFTLHPALAQQGAPAAPPAPAPKAPAQENAIAPSHLAVAREVVVSSGLARTFESYVPQFSEQLKRTILATRPEIGNELSDVLKALQPEFETQKEEMMVAASRIYAQRMSEPELKEAVAFFKSAAGQKYVVSQPYILDDLFNQMQQWTQKLSDLMVTRVRSELKKKNIDL